MNLPIFGKALYDGLSEEFDRVNDFKDIAKSATVPNEEMDDSTLEDLEYKYGINNITISSIADRKNRIIERASMGGNGGIDWLEAQIQKAGFDLYVIENISDVEISSQFGDFQFNSFQFGSLVTYTDPRGVSGEIIASSPNGNIGGLFTQFGDFQLGSQVQLGTITSGFAYPRPKPFVIPAIPDRWGYVFFLSPYSDRLATSVELLALTDLEYDFFVKLLLQIKYTRNWCIAQVTTAELQEEITTDGLIKITTDGFENVVLSDL